MSVIDHAYHVIESTRSIQVHLLEQSPPTLPTGDQMRLFSGPIFRTDLQI